MEYRKGESQRYLDTVYLGAMQISLHCAVPTRENKFEAKARQPQVGLRHVKTSLVRICEKKKKKERRGMGSKPGLGTNGIIADTDSWEGRKDPCFGWHRPAWRAWRSACQEGSTRFLCRYAVIRGKTLSRKRKGPSQAKRKASLQMGMYTPSHSLYFFFLQHSCTLHSTKYVKTQTNAGRKHYGRSGTTSIKGKGKAWKTK